MNIIKLDATASTNTYLREMLTTCDLENFTVVVAENQFAGKGQRGSNWVSEAGSNLTFSVLLKSVPVSIQRVFDLNVMVALAVVRTLKKMYNLPFFIKWPNDILSYTKKICGILIENIIKQQGEVFSIVGIGINVNQKNFSSMSKASSLSIMLEKQLDKEELLHALLQELAKGYQQLAEGQAALMWQEYKTFLFRKDSVSAFELPQGSRFNGIIRDVTPYGKLVVEMEDSSNAVFDLKEVKLLY
ncbi:biotin--[acetyl-CoA-carboxylase] ligase [Myroides sp. WP-1]|uniref:biotin--[acetyl-CoA-carboxylase] ligase n=1 Tax=Myroides sp. WP-1 TaxID=2759944 RepID=UPI0015FB6C14|nr:biotin--[acetyl-CoA-carboxylase] ligase [Myroides sp. WP-1]MBB1138499.1 biotin--[acetyl-CoA-carboxylase] ligase [Myroides sp. WP-1]